MTQHSISPENLYLQFRQTRPGVIPDSAPATAAQFPDLHSGPDTGTSSLPEQVYYQYQQHRLVDREESIEAILSLIRHEQTSVDTGEPTQADSAAGSDNVGPTESGTRTGKPEPAGPLDALLYLLRHWIGLRSPALLLPVAAAGLLALFVFPQMFDSADLDRTDTGNGIPASLVSQAPSAVEFIDTNNAQVMAFSSSAAPGKSAFYRGVLATDILLAVEARDEPLIDSTLRTIARIAEAEGQAKLVTLVAEILHTTDKQPESDHSTTAAKVVSMLKTVAEDSGHELWFEHGLALQAVALSAYLHQSVSDAKPLHDSFAAYTALAKPLPVLPASKLVQGLKSLDSQSITESSNSRKVVGITRDIKVLMR